MPTRRVIETGSGGRDPTAWSLVNPAQTGEDVAARHACMVLVRQHPWLSQLLLQLTVRHPVDWPAVLHAARKEISDKRAKEKKPNIDDSR